MCECNVHCQGTVPDLGPLLPNLQSDKMHLQGPYEKKTLFDMLIVKLATLKTV